MNNTPKQFAQIALVTLLLLGCALVLRGFVAAILFAAVICITTWPVYARLLERLNQRHALASSLMTLALTIVFVAPLTLLTLSLAEGVSLAVAMTKPLFEQGLPAHPPEILRAIPFVGSHADDYWVRIASSREEISRLLRQAFDPARGLLFQTGGLIGNALIQLGLVVFIAFFFYRDGEGIAAMLRIGARRLGGDLGEHLLTASRSTVMGVMVGIVGTAAGQALVALIGFLIAGVPGALLLAAGTFFLSMVPIGPPLLWGGAAWWLYDQGETGWAIFMVLWGTLVISSIDNFLKPFLISKTASLPLLLIALGVFGGALSFGLIGVFLGPTLLALGLMLVQHWTGADTPETTPR
ncbi:AI-2E family transporter [Rhodocyclus tenuis]|uniref:AI-2E family transporter n=2 Tax=Rhodocyclus TaxID=1064 RepID=A0A6L5JYJ2_RHOTE|nr:AI-2E family transporter [Rhodocyclus gracilis]MQY51902.1 AI-2E family transporter [Rhodocyclus gracilis]NJA88481.1 AI-2E family transporter [Rhodocyclus gracilis]